MYNHLRCVALRTIRYDDRHSILTAWSDTHGRLSLSMPAGDSTEARRRRAITMPLSLFECEADLRPNHEIARTRDMRLSYVATSTISNPAKTTLAIFLADVLERVLRTYGPDKALSQFIFESVKALDRLQGAAAVANFHLWFLQGLSHHLGISPDIEDWHPGAVFDMREAHYTASAPTHQHRVEGTDAYAPVLLSRLHLRNLNRLRLSRADRNRLLDGILLFYTLHHTPLHDLPSLDILRQMSQ